MSQEPGSRRSAVVRALQTAGLLFIAGTIGLLINLVQQSPPLRISESRFEDALFEDLSTEPVNRPDSSPTPGHHIDQPIDARVLTASTSSPVWLVGRIESVPSSEGSPLTGGAEQTAR